MTAYFPSFYPDELVFSACSRYHERLGYRTAFCTSRDLFGNSIVRVATDLPHRLNDLSKALPVGHRYSPDRLLAQHTLFPIYTAFESLQRAKTLRKAMLEGHGPVHALAGALTIRLRSQFLRYCIECVLEDRQTWGETYWHRIHNVTGVETCPVHNIFLVESGFAFKRFSNLETFVTAENAININAQPPKRRHYKAYSILARELLWLLNRETGFDGHIANHNRYLRLLYLNGLATFSGVLRLQKLEAALNGIYPPDLLRALESEVDDHALWTRSVISSSARAQAPYRHILLLNLFDCSLKDFFALPPTPFAPFGSPPWPCLNRAAEHFKEPLITDCSVQMATDGSSRPRGIFRCSCGFVYSRFGPDTKEEDRFCYYGVREYGTVWYEKLKSLLFLERRSRKETAAMLGVSTAFTKKAFAKLPGRGSPSSKLSTADIEERRAKWSETFTQNPGLSRNELRTLAGNAVYGSLRRYDREWLENHSPPGPKAKGRKPITNWPEKDLFFAAEVSKVVTEILETPGKPIRYSATLLGRRLGVLEIIQKRRPHLLPLTRTAIHEAAESVIDFAIRRVRWAAATYKSEGILFNVTQLKARSGLSSAVVKNVKVLEVVRRLVNEV